MLSFIESRYTMDFRAQSSSMYFIDPQKEFSTFAFGISTLDSDIINFKATRTAFPTFLAFLCSGSQNISRCNFCESFGNLFNSLRTYSTLSFAKRLLAALANERIVSSCILELTISKLPLIPPSSFAESESRV